MGNNLKYILGIILYQLKTLTTEGTQTGNLLETEKSDIVI